MSDTDPALYFTGLWARLPQLERDLILGTEDEREDGRSRFAQEVDNASHVVALRTLGFVARAEDAASLPRLPEDLARAGELVVAWCDAASEVLQQQAADADGRILTQLSAIATDERVDQSTRRRAVLAIRASISEPALAALHALSRGTEDDVRIEALAALAARGDLERDEIDLVRGLFAQPTKSGVFAERQAELRASMERIDDFGASSRG